MEKKINKDELYLLKECSSISDTKLNELLEEHSYAKVSEWRMFISYFILALGAGLALSGVVFFFAYNWTEMSSFVKFAVIILLLIAAIGLSVVKGMNSLIGKVALLGGSVLIGVLFAVFGQVYQTGANAYDLFLMWVLAITAWTFVSKFTPQWLLYAVLANTTLSLYFIQAVKGSNAFYVLLSLMVLNLLLLGLPYVIGKFQEFKAAIYYKVIMTFACYVIGVVGIAFIVFTNNLKYSKSELTGMIPLSVITIAGIILGYVQSERRKDILLYSYSLLAIVSIGFIVLLRLFDIGIGSLLVYAIYIVGATMGMIKMITSKLKMWKDERA